MNTPFLQEAISASARGDSSTALALLSQAASEQPNSGIPHLLMGAEHAKLGDIDKAEAGFSNALLLEPGLLIARYQLGLLQLSSARAAIALVTWQPLFQLDESNPLLHFVRGFEALVHDHFAEATLHFEAGLTRNVDNPALSEDIRKVMERIGAVHAPRDQAPAAETDATEADFNFLLANYQQKGPGH